MVPVERWVIPLFTVNSISCLSVYLFWIFCLRKQRRQLVTPAAIWASSFGQRTVITMVTRSYRCSHEILWWKLVMIQSSHLRSNKRLWWGYLGPPSWTSFGKFWLTFLTVVTTHAISDWANWRIHDSFVNDHKVEFILLCILDNRRCNFVIELIFLSAFASIVLVFERNNFVMLKFGNDPNNSPGATPSQVWGITHG